jgi:hypothetical protein
VVKEKKGMVDVDLVPCGARRKGGLMIRDKCPNVVPGYREIILPAPRWIDRGGFVLKGGDSWDGWVG